jgi:MprA protease rhombosortase-interaction domain-containing protein
MKSKNTTARLFGSRLLAGLIFGLAASTTWAQNAVVGKQLYLNTNGAPLSCGSGTCHGPDPALRIKKIQNGTTGAAVLAAITSVGDMRFLANAPYTVTAQQAADIAAYIVNPAAANGPAITLSGTTLTFGSTQLAVTNSTSTPASITLTNTGGAALTITGIARSGTNAAEFNATGSCSGGSVTVNPGATCTIGAAFTPMAAGTRAATFTLQSNAATSPSITLSGTAAAAATPSIVRSVTSLTFNTQTVGTTSAARQVTITNNGTMTVSITQVASTPTPEFASTSNCVGNLAAGASCTINVTFAPSATGTRSGSLSITSNATGSPHAVTLSGAGALTPTAAATLASSALSFPSTTAGTTATALRTTLTNTGNAALTIASVAISGTDAAEFRLGTGNTCAAGSLAVNASCQIEAEFTPQSSGSKSANLVVTHGVGASSVALGGTGMAAATTSAGGSSPSIPTASAPTSSAVAPSNVGGGGAIEPWTFVLVLLTPLLLRRRLKRVRAR